MSLPQTTAASSSATADTEMFDEQQDYIRSLERLSQPADPLGASAFPSVKVDVDEDMTMTTSSSATATEPELGFGERFPEEEEKRLLAESNSYRLSGNTLFTSSLFMAALDAYNLALEHCPVYLTYEAATIHNNISAVHLKLQNPAEAVKSATKALEGRPGWSKALYRRAKGREAVGGWSSLQGAHEDYMALLEKNGEGLTEREKRDLEEKVKWLPRRIEEAREKDTCEVLGKLKDLGNGLLRPFGLSTDNFGMVKDEKTGGYSLSFGKGAGKR
ncbi:uncharacterized protein H6S33_009753 [Morchella sextelata]|uniref:uncharacterized protein n=1 Tax=Morchella sextelata TaxID=1174677 RepID=UPI001D03C405|nr:uncharacterized protein H6S33_009753 [Morchella sextelata]KAH0613373.1 hypothetical protein H6S33_009753 [Morchella sextelata]